MSSLVDRLQRIPTPIAGLALGSSSLGWSWENFASLDGVAQRTGAILSGVLILMLVAKYIVKPQLLRDDLAHPVLGSIVPTATMTLMVISVSIREWLSVDVGIALWMGAVFLHLVFMIIFLRNRARNFELHHMVPSWFIPPVGIIVADVSFPGVASLHSLSIGVFYLGMIMYAIMPPIMLYRFIFAREIPDAAKPTIAIMAAPASLSLAGYLTVIDQPSPLLVALLAGVAILMTTIIYLAFTRLLRLPFCPGYAAFTFPMVIGATALSKTAMWMNVYGFSQHDVAIVHGLAALEITVATLVVGYVALQYLNSCLPLWGRRAELR